MNKCLSLLDEALGAKERGRVIVVEDCVETSGAFVLHHLMKRALTSEPLGFLVFISLSQPFSHYDRILRKLGCNLMMLRDTNRFFFYDMLKLDCPDGDGRLFIEGGLVELYGKIHKAVEICASVGYDRSCITIMIDDLSLMEIAAHGSTNHVMDFMHYCHTLTSEMDCALVMLNHGDICSSMAAPRLSSPIEYLADVVIETKPLATGLATDVHGQLTVVAKGIPDKSIRNFHFRVKESNVDYFYPGTRT